MLKVAATAALFMCLLSTPAAHTGEIEVETVVLQLIEEANVPAQESGVLMTLNVREGALVKRGDVLGQIDDRVVQLEAKTAALELESARAEAENDVSIRFAAKAHEVAEAELARSTSSIRTFAGSVSQSQLDVERLNVEKTALEKEQARHERSLQQFEVQLKEQKLAAARLQMLRRKITAPLEGTIVETFVRRGEWIEPGQKVLRIVSTKTLKAEGFISAKDARHTLQGAAVRLVAVSSASEDANLDQEAFGGSVAFVSPEIDPITEQVRVWAEIDNPSGALRPGQRVRMWLLVD